MMSEETISKTFAQRPLGEAQKEMIALIGVRFSQIEEELNKLPASRLKSIAMTEIEKTALVVNKAISRMNDAA